MIKKTIFYTLAIIFLSVFALFSVLFFKPTWIINPRNIDFVLHHTSLLKSWSWKDAKIDHQWQTWNQRIISGHFTNLCLVFENPGLTYSSCFEKLSWNFELSFIWEKGLYSKSLEPLIIRSKETSVITRKTDTPEATSLLPDLYGYWQLLWMEFIPDIDALWEKVVLSTDESKLELEVNLVKKARELTLRFFDFTFQATPTDFELRGPRKYPFPKKLALLPPLFFYDMNLKGEVTPKGIPLKLTGNLEVVSITVDSYLDLPLQNDFSSLEFRRNMILKTKANFHLPGIKKALSSMMQDPYRELPAPLNAMDGDIDINVKTDEHVDTEVVLFKSHARIDMKGAKQVLDVDLKNEVPLNLTTFEPGVIALGIEFNEVALQLPRLSKKSPPPQFLPDGRFKKGPYKNVEEKDSPIDLNMHLKALEDKALAINTNLLDEALRLNFNLLIRKGNLQKGFVSTLPLKTTVFRRPIEIQKMKVTFDYPQDPVIEGTLFFPLPEYKVTLDLEGPVSQPRYRFSSEPPLPQSDIYSVLLFGRPTSELNQEDKTAAQKTNQILAQGILSLSVLYFFAGSPVEYVGFDPDSKNATAQFGLNSKTSLRVGGGQEGVNSSAIRRSLGKGWYLDTSVQDSTTRLTEGERSYGVLLERIIAY